MRIIKQFEGEIEGLIEDSPDRLTDCVAHRCSKHRHIAVYNHNEFDDSECAACEAEPLREHIAQLEDEIRWMQYEVDGHQTALEAWKEAAECVHEYIWADCGSGPSGPREKVCYCSLCGFERGTSGTL